MLPSPRSASERDALPPYAIPAPPRFLRVLVVDDVAMNRDIAAAFIHSAGHEVDCAENGMMAVQAVVKNAFDVVTMDLRMPGIDGFEAARRIRALEPAGQRVPIVALTAAVSSEQAEQCRAAGMDGHLAKPFTLESLLGALALGIEAGRRETGPSGPAIG